jgi:putative SOS response-associated peptidase YedK
MYYDAKAGKRSLDVMRWGLPHWATDINISYLDLHARAEGVDNTPTFCEAFQRRRRLVPLGKKNAAGKTSTFAGRL